MRTGVGNPGCLLLAAVTSVVPVFAEQNALVLTQSPVDLRRVAQEPAGMPWPDCGAGARIVLRDPVGETRVLTGDFHSACDPRISFDGRRMLFAGRVRPSDAWNIYEMELAGGPARQVTREVGNARNPVYQGSHYTIVADRPWYQITFVSDRAGELNEHAPVPSTSLYSSRLDGTDVRRLTFNPSSDMGPTLLPDGRLLFSSWQRATLERGPYGRIGLFAAQTDGIDYALFSADEGRRVKLTPAVTVDRRVVFVENDELTWDGAGNLASVSLRRNLHSYRRITEPGEGLFSSPSPMPDGSVLVSRRPEDGSGTYGIFRVDPRSASIEAVFDDPEYHDIQAAIVASSPEPDGRSSVVTDTIPNGTFYGLDVYESDLGEGWIARGSPLRLRVLEGVPETAPGRTDPLLPRRVLGVVPVEEDGSFSIEVPANIPIQLQLLDEQGMALRSCGWIWVRNRETRGCIGCHEDGERTPDNRFAQALSKRPVPLTLPPERRRTVDFGRDVKPILQAGCGSADCHGNPHADLAAHVDPGRARTSPLVWQLFGRNTSRAWDGRSDEAPRPVPAHRERKPLGEEARRILLEWIDLGAEGGGP